MAAISLNQDLDLTIYDINTFLGLGLANAIQVVNSGIIVLCALNGIDSCWWITFINTHKVPPALHCPICRVSALWNI